MAYYIKILVNCYWIKANGFEGHPICIYFGFTVQFNNNCVKHIDFGTNDNHKGNNTHVWIKV